MSATLFLAPGVGPCVIKLAWQSFSISEQGGLIGCLKSLGFWKCLRCICDVKFLACLEYLLSPVIFGSYLIMRV